MRQQTTHAPRTSTVGHPRLWPHEQLAATTPRGPGEQALGEARACTIALGVDAPPHRPFLCSPILALMLETCSLNLAAAGCGAADTPSLRVRGARVSGAGEACQALLSTATCCGSGVAQIARASSKGRHQLDDDTRGRDGGHHALRTLLPQALGVLQRFEGWRAARCGVAQLPGHLCRQVAHRRAGGVRLPVCGATCRVLNAPEAAARKRQREATRTSSR